MGQTSGIGAVKPRRTGSEGIHAVGEIKVRNTFIGETHAVAEAEFVRKDGILVPYSVIYDVAAGKITALRLYFTGPVRP